MVEYELQRRSRFGSIASLIIADIDHFKAVNDTYGHDVGDIVLKEVARSMLEAIRGTDTLARWGGEEFIVLLPDTDEQRAFALAEKIRKNVMDLRFERCQPITVSLGLSQHGIDETFLDWFKEVDGALYRAKDSGRNRTVAASGVRPDSVAGNSISELLMLQIPWRDEYRVGVDSYDAQHRALFSLANGLINAIVNDGRKDEIISLLRSISTESAAHFKDEEGYLRAHKYSFIERHAKEHAFLLQKLESHITAFVEDSVLSNAVISFICTDLIVKHILGEDRTSFQEIA